MSKEMKNVSTDSTKESDEILPNKNEKNLKSSISTFVLTNTTISSEKNMSKTNIFTETTSSKVESISTETTTPIKIVVPKEHNGGTVIELTMLPENISSIGAPISTEISTPSLSPVDTITLKENKSVTKSPVEDTSLAVASISSETSTPVQTLVDTIVLKENDDVTKSPSEDYCDCGDVDCPGCFFPCPS